METRNVTLLVGNRTYNLVTSLGDEKLNEVATLLHDVVSTTDARMLQDERLFLASLQLASSLVTISAKLDDLTNCEEISPDQGARL